MLKCGTGACMDPLSRTVLHLNRKGEYVCANGLTYKTLPWASDYPAYKRYCGMFIEYILLDIIY